MAHAHHDAAHGHKARSSKTKLLGAEQRGNYYVATRLELAVRFDDNARAQVVHQQRLMRLGQTEFPRQAGVLDRCLRRGPRAAVMS